LQREVCHLFPFSMHKLFARHMIGVSVIGHAIEADLDPGHLRATESSRKRQAGFTDALNM
jgi:hypothetical protein